VAASNSYEKLLSTVNTNAKTITVTLNSINDPLLAIGGVTKSTSTSSGISGVLWALIIAIAIVVVLLAVFIVYRMRRRPAIRVVETRPSR
jgi:subtilase family serine protease